MNKVLEFLARSTWIRKASIKGVISFFKTHWNLSTRYKHQYLHIKLDPQKNQWVVSHETTGEIKRFHNDLITKKKLQNLSKH